MKLFRIALIATLTTTSGFVFAAVDGTLGTTSTGTSDISVTKENTALISGIDDIAFGTLGLLPTPAVETSAMCVYSANAGAYGITISSGNGAFTMNEPNGGTLAYSVRWADSSGILAAVTDSTPTTTLLGSSTELDCASDTAGGVANSNAILEVTIVDTDYNAAPSGDYTDTLTLLITPE